MDKPKPNKLAQFYSGQIQPNGALSLRRSVQFWSSVDTASYKEDGKYFTADDVPTFSVQDDGTIDWP